MKVIGLIGGMSWDSFLEYYRLINESVAEKLGGLHSARIILYSLDFDDYFAESESHYLFDKMDYSSHLCCQVYNRDN